MHSYDQQNESPYLAVSRLICEKKINDKKKQSTISYNCTHNSSIYVCMYMHTQNTYIQGTARLTPTL